MFHERDEIIVWNQSRQEEFSSIRYNERNAWRSLFGGDKIFHWQCARVEPMFISDADHPMGQAQQQQLWSAGMKKKNLEALAADRLAASSSFITGMMYGQLPLRMRGMLTYGAGRG